MTDAYYGRALAYEEALQSRDDGALLNAALTRNVYRGRTPSVAALAALASYVRALDQTLSQSTDDAVLAADIAWPAIAPGSLRSRSLIQWPEVLFFPNSAASSMRGRS